VEEAQVSPLAVVAVVAAEQMVVVQHSERQGHQTLVEVAVEVMD
jgi:hypothetical protein